MQEYSIILNIIEMLAIFRSRLSTRAVSGVQAMTGRSVAAFSTPSASSARGSGPRATGPHPVRRHPNLKAKRPLVQKYRKINGELDAKAASQKLPFRLVGST
jgi:hypothetical protein